jgi:hypothetical protein
MGTLKFAGGLPRHPKARNLRRACGDDHSLLSASWMTWAIVNMACAENRTNGQFVTDTAIDCVGIGRDSVLRSLQALAFVGMIRQTGVDAYEIVDDATLVTVTAGAIDDGWATERAKVGPIVFARDGGLCTYCGSSDDPTIDHIVPRVRGGDHELHNLTTACRPCNSAKSDRTPEEWVNRPARCVAYAASKAITMESPAC